MMMLIGSLVWAWVIGTSCSLLAAFNPYETEYLNFMVSHLLTPTPDPEKTPRQSHTGLPQP